MTTADAPGPRIDAAKTAATGLVDALPAGSHLAVLAYGTGTGTTPPELAAGCRDITTVVDLGPLDKTAARSAIDALTPRGFTPIAASLRRAADALPAGGPASIVLVSDGEDTCGAPPCDVARELKSTHPELEVSTIGFKTDSDASATLRCIAEATGGMFVDADNAAQLSKRLLAAQDRGSRSARLNGPDFHGLRLGMALDEIRRSHPDFPTTSHHDGTLTVYEWRDCGWVFDDGRLTEIRPPASTRTLDGIGVGSTVAQAGEYYGRPVSDGTVGGTRTLVFTAGTDPMTGYRMTVDGPGDDARVIRVVVCGCSGATRTPTSSTAPATGVGRPLPETPPIGSCDGRVLAKTDYRHPALGLMRVFLVKTASTGCVVPVTASGKALPAIEVEVYDTELHFPAAPTDATGNLFVEYNPGRYNGVLVLVPTDSGFADIGWTTGKYIGRLAYYYAQLQEPGGDGRYTLEQSSNDCDPDCAGGTVSSTILHWNGHDYVK